MKLERRAILQSTLAAGATALLAWWSSDELLQPVRQHEGEVRAAIASLDARLEKARGVMKEVRALELDATAAREQIEQLERGFPAGPVTVWLPELVKRHFGRFGLEGAIVRMNTVQPVADLPGYSRGYWSLGMPIKEGNRSDLGTFLAAAELERQHPYVRVMDFAIRPEPEDPSRRTALLNVSVLIRD